ncbi:hypothetical protein COOONC_20794, partial [Cooperia oncophora]
MQRRLCDFIYPIIVLALGFLFGQRLGRLSGYEYFRPVKNSTIEDEELLFNSPLQQSIYSKYSIGLVKSDPSRYLFDEVKIFCWVATELLQISNKKAYFKMDTWGRQCNRILFVSNATDEKLPILLAEQDDTFLNLFRKTRQAFLWIYENVV